MAAAASSALAATSSTALVGAALVAAAASSAPEAASSTALVGVVLVGLVGAALVAAAASSALAATSSSERVPEAMSSSTFGFLAACSSTCGFFATLSSSCGFLASAASASGLLVIASAACGFLSSASVRPGGICCIPSPNTFSAAPASSRLSSAFTPLPALAASIPGMNAASVRLTSSQLASPSFRRHSTIARSRTSAAWPTNGMKPTATWPTMFQMVGLPSASPAIAPTTISPATWATVPMIGTFLIFSQAAPAKEVKAFQQAARAGNCSATQPLSLFHCSPAHCDTGPNTFSPSQLAACPAFSPSQPSALPAALEATSQACWMPLQAPLATLTTPSAYCSIPVTTPWPTAPSAPTAPFATVSTVFTTPRALPST